MKRIIALLLSGLALFAAACAVVASPPTPPAPTEWVTDSAGYLSGAARDSLNSRLKGYESSTGHQVLVWIGATTGQAPVEEWCANAFASWKVGRKGMDDGLVLFLFTSDRTAHIEVGYGLEDKVTDAAASRIIREVIVPKLQAGDHDGAVSGAVDRLIAAAGGSVGVPRPEPGDKIEISPAAQVLIAIAIVLIVILMARHPALTLYILSSIFRRGGSGGGFGGGGFSGGGGRSGGGGATGRW